MAVFGSTLLYSVDNSVVATQDRLEYGYYPNVFSAYRQVTIPYAGIEKIEVGREKDHYFLFVTTQKGETVKLDIKADESEVRKFYGFVNGYKPPVEQQNGFDMVAVRCPNCGASNELRRGDTGVCEYCGSGIGARPK